MLVVRCVYQFLFPHLLAKQQAEQFPLLFTVILCTLSQATYRTQKARIYFKLSLGY